LAISEDRKAKSTMAFIKWYGFSEKIEIIIKLMTGRNETNKVHSGSFSDHFRVNIGLKFTKIEALYYPLKSFLQLKYLPT